MGQSADIKVAKAWEELYNQTYKRLRNAGDILDDIGSLLSSNGCDCECEHHWEEHDEDCELCLACKINNVLMYKRKYQHEICEWCGDFVENGRTHGENRCFYPDR